MEFSEKLQELRKQKGLTQEEVAKELFVSRTAISKWESGRGYPNIESLKRIAKLFSITIDQLLSGDELLSIAEQDNKQKENLFRDFIFGLLDICALLLLFLPFFAQKTDSVIKSVSLLELYSVSAYIKIIYFVLVIFIAVFGVLTLALQNCKLYFWVKAKNLISLILNIIATFVFIITLQPYPAIFLLVFLVIKALSFMIRKVS